MKTFQQFQEQATDRFKNTKDVIQGVFSGKDVAEIKADMQSGKIDIGKFKKFVNSSEAQSIPFKLLQGVLQDTSKIVDSTQNKVNTNLNKIK